MRIDWQYPQPRKGRYGAFDKFIGAGATRAEVLLQLGVPFAAATLIVSLPRYRQRPISLPLYSIAILLSLYVLDAPLGVEWFLPLFYLKLLVSHLVREEPYRP